MAQTPESIPDQDSIDYYLQVVKQGERKVGIALANIGYIYQNAGRYNSALDYFDRAWPLLNGERRTLEVAKIHQAKGSIYEIFGDKAEPAKYYKLARISYLRATEILKEKGSTSALMLTNQNLADIEAKRGNFNRAVIYQNRVIKSLTGLYQDSLQSQAESFNDLLNKEIKSSKDTIYVETPNVTETERNTVSITNWRHILILLLTIGFLLLLFGLIGEYRKSAIVGEDLANYKAMQKQLTSQKEELQSLNLALTKTEKDQRRANMTKDKLFSIISHDLRSPINTIAGFLNILGTKLSSVGDIELRSLAKEMVDTTDRMSLFLDDLLKWSMSQLGQIKPSVEKISMKKLIEENYQLVKPRLLEKNIQFKASVPDNVELFADANMLRVILRNLISNAIKFTKNGGYIYVSLKKGKEGVSILEVADDGIGISAEKLQNLFDFKGSKINGGHGNEGTGLGLLLCKEFAEINGGEIEVTSKLGEGTIFTIKLPDYPPV